MKIAFVFLFCLAVCAFSNAQQAKPTVKPTVVPEGMIDGSKHPEKIPDLVAYRLLFVQLQIPPNPTHAQEVQYRGRIEQIPLSDTDRFTLELAIRNFQDVYRPFVEYYKKVPLDDEGVAERDAITQDAITYCRNYMSPTGFHNLDTYVQHAKTRMKMVPMPKM